MAKKENDGVDELRLALAELDRRTFVKGATISGIGVLSGVGIGWPGNAQATGLELWEMVERLIGTKASAWKDARGRRVLFNSNPEEFLADQGLTDSELVVRLFEMNRTKITQYVVGDEGKQGWNKLDLARGEFDFPPGEWPAKDSNPACAASSERLIETEYPDPNPEVYSIDPINPKAGALRVFNVHGRGIVPTYLTAEFKSRDHAVVATVQPDLTGTFRCGRIQLVARLPWDEDDPTYNLHLTMKGGNHSYEIGKPGSTPANVIRLAVTVVE